MAKSQPPASISPRPTAIDRLRKSYGVRKTNPTTITPPPRPPLVVGIIQPISKTLPFRSERRIRRIRTRRIDGPGPKMHTPCPRNPFVERNQRRAKVKRAHLLPSQATVCTRWIPPVLSQRTRRVDCMGMGMVMVMAPRHSRKLVQREMMYSSTSFEREIIILWCVVWVVFSRRAE